MKYAIPIFILALLAALAIGTLHNPSFWQTSTQRGDALLHVGDFRQAAKTYTDPQHIGQAQYRNGDFEQAAKTFARISGATGAYNQANALLMHGKYAAAISAYDRALALRPNWREALDNKKIALARKARLDASGESAADEQTGQGKPDDIVFDMKGDDQQGKTIELSGGQPLDDASLQATWLRRVQTTPADFLRAKFAYQASKGGTP